MGNILDIFGPDARREGAVIVLPRVPEPYRSGRSAEQHEIHLLDAYRDGSRVRFGAALLDGDGRTLALVEGESLLDSDVPEAAQRVAAALYRS